MTELAIRQPAAAPAPRGGGALSLAAMGPQDAWRFAEALAGSSLLPREYRGNPSSVLWALEYGRALGLDVVTTITTIHVINNRPTQSADLMLSRAREAGHRVRIAPGNGECTVSIWRSDDPEFENRVTWTTADARQANLLPGKPDSNWAKYPRAMLRARAVAECVRMACPEVLHGAIYTPEELGARVDAEGLPVDSEVHELRTVRPTAPLVDEWSTPAPGQQVDAPATFVPDPAVQAFADVAATATWQGPVRETWKRAGSEALNGLCLRPGADTPEPLGAYLTALLRELPAEEPQDGGEVVDGEVVPDAPVDEHAAAVAEFRSAAAEHGLTDPDGDAHRELGVPLAAASVDAIRGLTALMRGAA